MIIVCIRPLVGIDGNYKANDIDEIETVELMELMEFME